ncbi:Crp/Fnr family transcriptional regulator [uncultured Veillonella sp.]|uniref:Crp/Fnr family transcriptional regulator n=1 Tax=uncultured Veillonella sp. TaxID=159268 RepID=UPI0025DC88EC|nr:Crp/Fnr family transcriptional regulator [uncultured Veillonella sp.]
MKNTYERVRDLRAFKDVSKDDFLALYKSVGMFSKKFKKGAYIALSEDEVPCVSVIISGIVHMVSEDMWGNRTIIVFMNRGDLFGESFACSSNQVSLVNFYAASEVESIYIPYESLLKEVAKGSELSGVAQQLWQNTMTLLADKNVRFVQKLEIVSKRTLREKLMTYLSFMAKVYNSLEFDLPLGRVALSEYLCVDRSALTRELSRMQDDGLIAFEKNHFKVLAPVHE